ncbi:hypothetical protein Tco_1120296 [Tanacetum coccineum]
MLDQTFDRLQNLVRQLKLLDKKLSQEDVNQTLLRSLSPEWNTHAVVWRNKVNLDTMSMYDLYNNLKVYEPEVKGMSSSSSSTQNMAFVSSSNKNTNNTSEAVNTAHLVSTASTQVNAANFTNIDNLSDAVIFSFFASQPNSPQLAHKDLQQITPDDMEEMDLRWQMVMLTMRARRALRNQYNKNKEISKRSVPVETTTSTALVSCDGLDGYDWSDQAKKGPNYALMAYSSSSSNSKDIQVGEITIRELRKKLEKIQKEKDSIQYNVDKFENASNSLNKLIECQIVDNCKKGLGYEKYNAVSPPCTRNFMPPTPDLSFTDLDEFVNKHVVSDSEEENVSQTKTEKKIVKPSIAKIEFVKPKQQEKTARKTVKQIEKNRGKNVNTARPKAVVNAVQGNNVNVVKASACWVWKPKTKVLDHGNLQMDLQDQGVIDSGCSRHMTGNMSYLTDYEEIDGGYVAFGGNPKGGKITRKGTIKTGNLDFENVYFVRELKFNLFSVSQMCDKKNSVLFNDTECIVLSPNFKLIDESQVLLRVPRKNNMYSVDLKNIVPKGGFNLPFCKSHI